MNQKSELFYLPIAIFSSALVAYIPAILGGYVWDDSSYLVNNWNLRSIRGLYEIWFNLRSNPQYYPMVFTTFWAEYQLWGLNALGYHFNNVLIHSLNAILIWAVLRKLKIKGAWIAAFLFALHPVHVESVAWISERKNVLSLFFYLSSFFIMLSFYRVGEPNGSVDRYWRYIIGFLLFICALFSKTVTFSLPAAILLVIWCQRGRITRKEVVFLLPFFIAGIVFGFLTSGLEQSHVGASGSDWDYSWLKRFLIAGRAIWFYAGKLILPHPLIFNYPRWNIEPHAILSYFYPAGAAAVVLLLWKFRDKFGRAPLVGVLFFIGTLFPALGFINVYPFRFSFVADHFQYHASIGLIVCAAMIVHTAIKKQYFNKATSTVIPIVILAALGTQTWFQASVYQNEEVLWRKTIEKNPQSWLAYNNLGNNLTHQGKYDEAIGYLKKAIEIKPDYSVALSNLGATYIEQKEFDLAEKLLLQAVEAEPLNYSAHCNLGLAYFHREDFQKALSHYQRAIDLNPNFSRARYNMGLLLTILNKTTGAIEHLEKAARLEPHNFLIYMSLGKAYFSAGNTELAQKMLLKAYAANPEAPDVHVNLGLIFTARKNYRDALKHYLIALTLEPDKPEAHYNIANLYVQQNEIEKAKGHYRQAILLNEKYVEAYVNCGILHAVIGELSEAVRYFSKALEYDEHNAAARENLIRAFWLMGNKSGVNQEMARLEREQPQQAKRLLQNLEMLENASTSQ